MAPIKSIQEALRKANWSVDTVDLFELNEAFAAQSAAVIRDLRINPEKVFISFPIHSPLLFYHIRSMSMVEPLLLVILLAAPVLEY